MTDGACRTSASRLHLVELLVRRVDEERLREERVPGALADHAHGDAMRRVGAGERVDDVDVALAQARRHLVAQPLEVLLGDLGVDVSPPDPRLGARLAHDELVLGRAPRVLAGVDDERAALGEPGLASRERVLVELRGRRVPVDVPAHGDPVLDELVPIGNDRDHSAPSYATLVRTVTRECAPCVGAARLVSSSPSCWSRSSLAPAAGADLADERALAEKYAPIVRIVEQQDVCGYGEPFIPTDIDLLLGEQTVALRGPWNVTDLVEIGPTRGRPRRPLRVPPRLPGQRARSGLRLQPLGSAPDGGQRARRLRARRRRERASSPSSTGSSTPSTTSTTRTRATGR